MDYLALPFQLNEDYLLRADDLRESIAFSVGLLLCTRPGAMHFLPEYGCDVWEMEFSDVNTANKADVRASLRNAIAKFEKRLYDVSVSFVTPDRVSSQSLGLTVKVTATYRDEGEERKFEGIYNLG
ncbi:MAG: GPW/gp25 family protein [candidate division Zixibacteria bacterium]|nr:GPW/gp25 family protein [candidate division Zixibacteria bacterium]